MVGVTGLAHQFADIPDIPGCFATSPGSRRPSRDNLLNSFLSRASSPARTNTRHRNPTNRFPTWVRDCPP